MSKKHRGSGGAAAVAHQASPQSAAAVHAVIESLDLALSLARSAVKVEPGRAALILTGALDDLRPELRALRSAAKQHLR